MQDIVRQNLNRNGRNGSIGGRGVRRRKLTREQRINLAADMALGRIHVDPSIKMSAATVDVRPDEVRAELKARAARGKVEEQERKSAERAGTDTVKVLMLAGDGVIVTAHADAVNAERLLAAQKRARKSLLLQFAKLKTGTTDEWEVLYSLPTPIFVNSVQVA